MSRSTGKGLAALGCLGFLLAVAFYLLVIGAVVFVVANVIKFVFGL